MDSTPVIKSPGILFGGGLLTGIAISKILNKLTTSPEEVNKKPEKWVRVGVISQLIIYPVKSMPGIQVNQTDVTPLGLTQSGNVGLRDRDFLVVNSKRDFQTQRTIPSLAFIQPSVQGKILTLNSTRKVKELEEEFISIPFPSPEHQNNKVQLVRIWADKVQALDCGDKVAAWLSRVTQTEGLRLFHYAEESSQRKVAPSQRIFPAFSSNDIGTFQDETSFMLMSEESLEELNTNLDNPFTVRSFRPSILIKDSPEPWAEDFWSFIRIGNSVDSPLFKTCMPCQRCKITTIDPDTGEVREDGEPLLTLKRLKSQRQVGDSRVTKLVEKAAIMGTHMGLFDYNKNPNPLSIKIGDPVYAAVL